MKIKEIRAMRGPNYWSVRYQQLILMVLDLEELEERPSDQIPGFAERLEGLLPSMYEHACSKGYPGGFFERVREGTWMGHIIEHVALAIQTLAGMDCGFGRTRGTGTEGVYNVVFEYKVEEVGRYAAQAAVRIAQSLIDDRPYDLEKDIQAMKGIAGDHFPGPSTNAILEEARSRGIPVLIVSSNGLYQLGYGARQRRIRASMADTTSCIAVDVAGDKDETKQLLQDAGIPVPKGTIIKSQVDLPKAIESIGFPLVLKPLDGHQGKGITVGIRTQEEAVEALEVASAYSPEVIVEQCIGGYDFRVLVVNYKFVAATRRKAAAVTGDGQSTIRQLVDRVNEDPARAEGHSGVLTTIKIDSITEGILEHKGFTLDSVLKEGEVLYLKRTANLSTGGTATDVTDSVHPDNIKMSERIARIIGLDICGIDIATPGLDTPMRTNGGAVLEVNAAPGLRMHLAPSEGTPRNVAAPIIDMLFPEPEMARIPVVAITGTNGKTTVARMIAYIAQQAGHRTGLTTTDGIYLDGDLVEPGDNTGPISTQVILKEPDVQFAVLECARGGLLRSGLGFDRCDVGVVTNVAADHLGLGGINDVEQMAKVKSVVPETVKPEGYAVLNADDELVYAMHERVTSQIALFSLDNQNPRILAHCVSGGLAAVVENGVIVIFEGGNCFEVTPVEEVPSTFKGTAPYMVANVLAAALASYAAGIDLQDIRKGLFSFVPSARMTPGRMNLFQLGNNRLLVDYAHNPAALTALGAYLQKLDRGPKIGIVTGVGDRRDEDIIGIGTLAARFFDEIIIRFDKDLRGRKSDDILQLLMQGIRKEGPDKPVRVFPTEEEALIMSLRNAPAGSFIVDCTEKVPETLEIVDRLCREGAGSEINMMDDTDRSQAASSGSEITVQVGKLGGKAG
jgi:cyanophycin synthetase